jgi:hypothetical protein
VAIFSERYIPYEIIPVSMRIREKKNFWFKKFFFGSKERSKLDRIYPITKK